MADGMTYPHIDAAVALIKQGSKYLAVYNPGWEAFTLPITKRRVWQVPQDPPTILEEDWADAAARAAAEWLGRTVRLQAAPFHEIVDLEYSGRTGEWKHYHLQIFEVPVQSDVKTANGTATEWLTVDEFLDEDRRPISPTAREVMRQLKANFKV
jgi:hypothetical protein